MLAQKPGTYTRNYRKSPAQTDAPREYIDRFTRLFVVTSDYAMGRWYGSDERQSGSPLGVRPSGIWSYRNIAGWSVQTGAEVCPLIGPDYETTWKNSSVHAQILKCWDATDNERRGLWMLFWEWCNFLDPRESIYASPAWRSFLLRLKQTNKAVVGFENGIMTWQRV